MFPSSMRSLPLLCAPYSVSSFHVYHFLSAPGRSSRAGESTLCFFCFLLAIILLALCAFDLFSFSFTCLSSIITFILNTTTTVLCAMLFCLRLYMYNVWMFVMRMYPSTLTCLMLCLLLCSCCCNPNPDLLLSHVVVFHKLVYYILCMWMYPKPSLINLCVSCCCCVFSKVTDATIAMVETGH